MTPWPICKILRLLIISASNEKATRQIIAEHDRTLTIAVELGPEAISTPATVGFLPGVDHDMRNWSVAQILEHNTIVNNVFTDIVDHLLRDETYVSDLDPKHDVMPADGVGSERIEPFRTSVENFLTRVSEVTPAEMASTKTHPHPLSGPFTAKHWHAMFGFHLKLHRRQAEEVVKELNT